MEGGYIETPERNGLGGWGEVQICMPKIGMDANTIAGALGGNTIGLELHEKIG